MKKKLLILLTFVCLILLRNNVYAFDKNTIFELHNITGIHNGIQGVSGLQYNNYNNGTMNTYYTGYYYITSRVAEPYYVYCLDPGFSAPTKLTIDHYLTENKRTALDKKEYGIIAIFDAANAIWQKNKVDLTNEQRKAQYVQTELAVRMYWNTVVQLPKTQNGGVRPNRAMGSIVSMVANMLENDPELAQDYLEVTGYPNIKYVPNSMFLKNKPLVEFTDNTGKNIIVNAKELFKTGLKAAADYNPNNKPEVKLDIVASSDTSEVATDVYEKTFFVSIKLDNFSADFGESYFKLKNPTTESSKTSVELLGYSFNRSKDIDDYSSDISTSTNILELLKEEGKNTIYVAYKATVDADANKNCSGTFSINYVYDDINSIAAALMDGEVNGTDATYLQQFIMFTKEPHNDSYRINANVCEGFCSPSITLPQICGDDDTPDANGNATYEYREAYDSSNGKYKIKKCILENYDAGGNSHKLVDNANASVVANNPYCEIYCKEDYKFTVPYKINVDNGRYFRISMSVKGQQDCYSTKLNQTKFEKDVRDIQNRIIDAYNTLSKYEAIVEAHENYSSADDLPNTYSKIAICEKCGMQSSITADGLESNVCGKTNEDVYYTVKGLPYSYTVYNSNLTRSIEYGELEFGSVECDKDVTCEGVCLEKSRYTVHLPEEEYKEHFTEIHDYNSGIKTMKNKIATYVKQLEEAVKNYNGCIADDSSSETWDAIYKFDPVISYSYNEPNPQDYNGTKWIDQVRAENCNGAKCDVMVPINEKIYAEKCEDGDSRCTEVNKITTLFDNKTISTTRYCSSANMIDAGSYECRNWTTTPTYDTKYYINCTSSGCSYEEYKVTNLSYVHRVATAEGSYDTRKVYYTLTSGETKISATKVDNAYLVNGLPVGINTPPGTYFYMLSLDNIGQYYSSQTLGRIYGNDLTSLSSVVINNQMTINGDELKGNQYACTYAVTQTCKDANGVVHDQEECAAGENWSTCKQRLCPNTGSYCVKEAEAYYVCDTQSYNASSCTKFSSRDAAIAASSINHNCCPDCEIVCISNCVFDLSKDQNGKLALDFRPITPSVLNPNDRTLGYNWDANNMLNALVAKKAGYTISEIEARANLKVDNSADLSQLDKIEPYTMKITVTPTMAQWVREYNDDAESAGGYSNDTLECYDYTIATSEDPAFGIHNETTCTNAGYIWEEKDGIGSCKMANAFCYSTFLTELKNEFAEAVDSKARDNAIETAHKNYEVYKGITSLPSSTGDYEIRQIEDYWTVYVFTTLDVNGDAIPDVGPAWK